MAIAGSILRLDIMALVLIGLLDYAYCHFRIRRMTRDLVELPRGLSVRLYASLQPTEKLSERFYQAAIGSVMLGAVSLLPQAPPILWVGFAGFLAIASVWAYLLMVHRRETSPALQPSSGDRNSGAL